MGDAVLMFFGVFLGYLVGYWRGETQGYRRGYWRACEKSRADATARRPYGL